MKNNIFSSLIYNSLKTLTVAGMAIAASTAYADETVDTRIGKLTFQSGYPSEETVTKLYNEMDFQRATQAYLWGIPAVGIMEWYKAHKNTLKVPEGQIVSFLTFKEKLGILTPNYTTPYLISLVDLEETGPIVFDFPKGAMAGMILDMWQRVLADTGIVGPDKGEGGKYLVLPPGHAPVESDEYYVLNSSSRTIFLGLRLLDADADKAIKELIPQIKSYTWTPDGVGKPMGVASANNMEWSQMPPRGMAYWESLNEVVQREPVHVRDRLILAQLRFLGIEKGKEFKPDARQTKILEEAVIVGEAMAKANTSDKRVEPPFWPDSHWKHALVVSVDQRMPTYDQLDERAAWFYEAVVVSKAMLTETVGFGQRYLGAYKDSDGEWLSGGNFYKLHVPANPPAKRFWSVTAYDEDTRQMVINKQGRPDLSSRTEGIVKNDDGSIDVYFGPEAPKGHESNWVQTVAGDGFFTYFRFYGPTEAYFDRSWELPDFEKLKMN